jgi:hypothetical protein
MHRILTAYSKYFNSKYDQKGHVFNGPFKAIQVKTPQITECTTTIHQKIQKQGQWKNNYEKYPWSTYPDYLGTNRWGDLLVPQIVLQKYKDRSAYKEFVAKQPVRATQLAD